ncbi:Por secretion system C-terminal sorting domain-containing protein [Ekhidna lutea]|uniref:Por secretion system C-terminal sorting domain-containing protein n=1 Tax=Ekhidna lutea TaxID=447679 RepID=A0A239EW56_EKHLU|nr:Ig-like domain-containing protein [Ekhidna lutea]SNS48817.1 Por secretion system C-terminal sorting domain-containing protein [Ekhidna lutea]
MRLSNYLSKLFIASLMLFASHQINAQDTLEIFDMEYFFDVDPGFGSASPIIIGTPDSTISLVELLSTSGLSTGFHTLGVRARNVATNPKYNVLDTGTQIVRPFLMIDPALRSAGQWGITETRLVFVDQSDAGSIVDVDQIEYFFDVDPGVGSASQVSPFTAGNSIAIVESLNSDTLSFGFHLLGMRARAVGGAWGTTETRLIFVDQSDAGSIINVDQIEYFFDVDPGVGSASQVAPFSATNSVSIVESLNTDTLSFGFHTLGMRARSEGGAWGTTETRLIFVDQTQGVINVDQIEYFFDADPGVGSANQITGFSSGNSISIVENLTTNGLLPGFHVLGMRVRSESGTWGTTETRLIFVDEAGAVNDIVEFEYFIGTDPGVGNASPVTVATPGQQVNENVILDTDTVSVGNYQIHFRARNADGEWGLTESRPLQVVDMDPPTITSAEPLPTNTSPLNMTVTFGEAVNSFDQTDISVSSGGSVQGGSFNTVNDSTYTFLLDLSTEGLITIDIADSAAFAQSDGTPSPNANTFEIRYDITAPVVTIDPLTTVDTSPALTGTVDNDSVSVDITVDGSTYAASSIAAGVWVLNAGLISPPLTNGVYDLVVQATDSAGNVGTDATSNELTIDVLEVTVDALITSESTPELTGTVTDTTATVDVTVDGSTYAAIVNGDKTWQVSAGTINPALATGIYEVQAVADRGIEGPVNDQTANELTIVDILTITIDSLTTFDTTPELTGTVSDITASVDVIVDGNTYSATVNADSTWTLPDGTISPPLIAGTYDIIASADRGIEGPVVDQTIDELTVIIDINVSVNVLSTNNRSPELSGTISNPSATIDVTVDGSTYSATNNGDSTWTLAAGTITPDLVDGIYDVDVLADFAGNSGTDSTINELRIDGTAPTVAVDFLATSISSPELSGTVDDPDATVDVSVDGNNYAAVNNGDNTWTLAAATITPGLVDSTYSVIVTATDSLGNQGVDASDDELIITSTLLALSATAITSNTFNARWSQGEDVLNYELDVSSTSDFSTFVSGFESFETTATSAVVSGLDFATSYYYRVRLVNTADEVSSNSNTVPVKSSIDPETIADSTALVQIYSALDGSGWSNPVNWESARMRDWDGITLDASKLRVEQIDISGRGADGAMPNPFIDGAVGGLTAMTSMNVRDNLISGLMDFTGTSISDLDVSTNALDFGDLEPLIGITSLTYAPQADVLFEEATGGDPIKTPHLADITLVVGVEGSSNNTYSFLRNGVAITQGTDFNIADSAVTIVAIDYDNMGEFSATVTNSQLPELTLQVIPQIVYAIADLDMTIVDGNNDPLVDEVSGYLLEAVRRQQGFDTLEVAENVASTFTFPGVVLGNYLCGIEPSNEQLFIPTYFGDAFEWVFADTLEFREAVSVQVIMTEVPGDTEGPGVLDVLIEEDFPEEGSRIDARRRAAKRKCGLRRKRSGGRTGQDDDEFELIAYGETDENGEFKFGFLPEGIYRFFVEYPGIPLDESSVVQFEVGELGISDTEFKLEAFVTEEGIEVAIDRVLGLILEYFKDLKVYPNPTSDVIKMQYRHLKDKDVAAQLVDLSGNVLWTKDIRSGYEGYEEIDVSNYEEGIYLLHVYDKKDRNGHVVSYRIIVRE